jgi:hypothetical protein
LLWDFCPYDHIRPSTIVHSLQIGGLYQLLEGYQICVTTLRECSDIPRYRSTTFRLTYD